MRYITLFALCASLIACAACSSSSHDATASPGPPDAASQPASSPELAGSGYSTAIVIPSSHESDGVQAEYAWIRENLPGSHSTGQALVFHEGKSYDVVHVEGADGEKRDVYFDISSSYGKP